MSESVVFNVCNQFNSFGNLAHSEGLTMGMEGLRIGFNSLNSVGVSTSIHQKMIKGTGDYIVKLDSKGTLCHGLKTSVTLSKWVSAPSRRRSTSLRWAIATKVYFRMQID